MLDDLSLQELHVQEHHLGCKVHPPPSSPNPSPTSHHQLLNLKNLASSTSPQPPSFPPQRRSFSPPSSRKTADRPGTCGRVYGLRAHSFPPIIRISKNRLHQAFCFKGEHTNMIRRRQCAHFVAVHGVVMEETLSGKCKHALLQRRLACIP